MMIFIHFHQSGLQVILPLHAVPQTTTDSQGSSDYQCQEQSAQVGQSYLLSPVVQPNLSIIIARIKYAIFLYLHCTCNS